MRIASVAVEGTKLAFDRLYSYVLPDGHDGFDEIVPGCRVLVPFGGPKSKPRQGMVFSVSESGDVRGLKPVFSYPDAEPLLTPDLLSLAERVADRTFCPLFEAVRAMLPGGLFIKAVEQFTAAPDIAPETAAELPPDEREILGILLRRGRYVRKDSLLEAAGMAPSSDVCERLERKGLAVSSYEGVRRTGDATVRTARLAPEYESDESDLPKLTPSQKSVVEVLRATGSAAVGEICYFTGLTPAVVTALERKGVIVLSDEEVYRRPAALSAEPSAKKIELTDEQEKAFTTYRDMLHSGAGCGLLFGVTGSGKTKVYMRLIDECLDSGKGVIVLVPEISLTPQALALFYGRWGDTVAVLHSALSAGQRLDEWKRVRRGEARVVVGTRSAVFAPVKDLGLIIIDEEQERSYRSGMTPKYDARDCAKKRCADNGALLLLVSATPSIGTFRSAVDGRYRLTELKNRYGAAVLPEVITVDMSDRTALVSNSLSKRLRDELQANLDAGKQSLLLLNRRGFNTFAVCGSCRKVMTCPNCSISLTYHAANNRLMCHYCGYSAPFTDVCPDCGEKAVRYFGFGTQRIEEELSDLFPGARVLRMDADTTMARSAHETKLARFAAGDYDILLGTQMVAKGLDFPNVTLVGVISVDSQLYSDDYLSAERTFDLLTQVVGRSGRGSVPGRAVIQTLSPENEIIRLASTQDYRSFYETETRLRRAMIYPPYCDLCEVMFSSPSERDAGTAAGFFFQKLKEKAGENSLKLIILGPSRPRIEYLSGRHRVRLLIKCVFNSRFREALRAAVVETGSKKEFSRVGVNVTPDPEGT